MTSFLNEDKKLPKVFVAVLSYNGKDYLRNCLASLYKMNYPNFEVVVVDNNSQDGSVEMVRTLFSRAHFIKNQENIGFSAGNNVGIKFALEHMADWVLLLNQDTEVPGDMLEKLIKASEENPDVSIFSPLVYWGDTEKVWFSGGKIDWWRMKAIHQQKEIRKANRNTDFICGCSLMAKKEVFSKIGLFDEDFFLYSEDADFGYRAKKAGFKMAVTPETSIKHFEKSEEAAGNKIYWLVISGLIFFRKNASFLMGLWIKFYCLLRRIKNQRDIKEKKPNAYFVHKAYSDFKEVWKDIQ